MRRRGYTVVEASTGDKALALMREHQPDLAVRDTLMPNVTGIEVTRELAANATTATIPRP